VTTSARGCVRDHVLPVLWHIVPRRRGACGHCTTQGDMSDQRVRQRTLCFCFRCNGTKSQARTTIRYHYSEYGRPAQPQVEADDEPQLHAEEPPQAPPPPPPPPPHPPPQEAEPEDANGMNEWLESMQEFLAGMNNKPITYLRTL
jgi:hypothetical protein